MVLAFDPHRYSKVYVTWGEDVYLSSMSDQSLLALQQLGVTHVELLLTWYHHDVVVDDDNFRIITIKGKCYKEGRFLIKV